MFYAIVNFIMDVVLMDFDFMDNGYICAAIAICLFVAGLITVGTISVFTDCFDEEGSMIAVLFIVFIASVLWPMIPFLFFLSLLVGAFFLLYSATVRMGGYANSKITDYKTDRMQKLFYKKRMGQ